MQKNHPIHLNIPITKIDEEQRMVWGYATVEEVDAHGEIIGYEASKKAFPNWLGNIREMHGSIAVGKRMEVQFDDAKKGVWLGSYISESADGENAWIKVKEGILQAYSIGGTVKDFKMVKMDGSDHLMVTDYDLYEVSLVDNPACPSAMLQVVKSAGGHLQQTEKLVQGPGRPVAWWEQQFQFSPTQKAIQPTFMLYNKDSMPKKEHQLAKDIFSADALVDLGVCLADFIWFSSWEGKDTSDLEAALEAIKTAAATELAEDESFPESVAMAVEEAARALNITKVEELDQMIKSKPVQKTGVAVVDGDPRDANATTVAETTANTVIKPANQKVPKKVYGADGKSTTSKVNVVDGEERDTNADPVGAEEPEAPANEEQETPVKVTVNKPGDKVEADAATAPAEPETPAGGEEPEAPEDEATETSEAPEAPSEPAETAADPEKAASAGNLSKSTDSDLAKVISEAVGAAVTKAVEPLQAEIDRLKAQPAPSKRATTFMDVEKVEKGTGETELEKNKARFDELMAKANDFAAHPERGTVQDRVKIGVELRKLSRLMDPASRAQHAAIRASLPPQ